MTPDLASQLFDRVPLRRFSPYTAIQIQTVRDMGVEIRSLLDESMKGSSVSGDGTTRAYSLFWLWILGSYEIVRTFCQYKDCFSEEFGGRACALKKRLATLRIPFAKLELAGSGKVVTGEGAASFDLEAKDLKFEAQGHQFSLRALLVEFEGFVSSCKSSDVVMSIYGQRYTTKAN